MGMCDDTHLHYCPRRAIVFRRTCFRIVSNNTPSVCTAAEFFGKNEPLWRY